MVMVVVAYVHIGAELCDSLCRLLKQYTRNLKFQLYNFQLTLI